MDTLNVDKNLSKLLKDLHNKENKLSYKAYRNHVFKALETYPNDLYLLTEMSYLEYRLDNFAVAMNYVKRVEEVDPRFCYMLCHKAWMLYDSDAPFQEAYDAWKTVAEMPLEALVSKKYGFDKRWAQSRQTDACFYIANLYMTRSEYSEAERYVKLHLERRKRGLWSNFTKKEVEEFLRELSFYAQNQLIAPPKDSSAFQKIIRLVEDAKVRLSHDLFKCQIQKALDVYSNDVYLLTEMSYAESLMGNMEDAMTYLRQAEEQNPYFGYMLYHKAWMLYNTDAPDKETLDAWNVIIDMPLEALISKKYHFDNIWAQSAKLDAYYYSAVILRAMEKYDEAEKYIKTHLEHRKRGLPSCISKKKAEEFLRELSFVDRNHSLRSNVDYGPTMPQHVYKRFDEYIKKLDKYKDKDKICRYYRKYLKKYSGDYYLWTVFSEYCYDYNMPKECLLAAEKANMICDTRDDMLVVYDYGSALYLNGRYDEAMREFEYLLSKSMDYIAYNIHGEGMRYAKRLVHETNEMVELTKKAMSDE